MFGYMGAPATSSPYADQGLNNMYGYGGLFGGAAGGGGGGGGLIPTGGGGGGLTPMSGGGGNYGDMGWSSPFSNNPSEFSNYITKEGNIAYSPVGEQERILDMMFNGAASGSGGGPIANQLFNLGMGRLPPALAEQIMGQTSEQFGKMGARFGTDLGTAMTRGLAQASEAQSLDAIKSILGLGGTTAGFQFQRGESGLNRGIQDLMSQRQTDPMLGLVNALLGGGFG
jgi:hypothetical protein